MAFISIFFFFNFIGQQSRHWAWLPVPSLLRFLSLYIATLEKRKLKGMHEINQWEDFVHRSFRSPPFLKKRAKLSAQHDTFLPKWFSSNSPGRRIGRFVPCKSALSRQGIEFCQRFSTKTKAEQKSQYFFLLVCRGRASADDADLANGNFI